MAKPKSAPEKTGEKRKPVPPVEHQFKPGNPGRPKGSRNKLGEAFLQALHDDFEQHGPATIARVREERPHEYLKVTASILPKELNVKVSELDDLTDDQLQRQLAAGLAALAAAGFDPLKGTGSAEATQPAGGLPTIQ